VDGIRRSEKNEADKVLQPASDTHSAAAPVPEEKGVEGIAPQIRFVAKSGNTIHAGTVPLNYGDIVNFLPKTVGDEGSKRLNHFMGMLALKGDPVVTQATTPQTPPSL
jgi:hypothetical protein